VKKNHDGEYIKPSIQPIDQWFKGYWIGEGAQELTHQIGPGKEKA
jgi:hypothetical protein